MRKSLFGLVALVAFLARCSNVRVAPEDKLVFEYSEGIQSLHQPTYDDFFLACHPEWQETNLSARMAGYEATRKGGQVTFSADGLEAIKLAALGRGAYFKVGNVVREGNRLHFRTLVMPDYIAINYAGFPQGAVLYLMGEPLGIVIALRPGKVTGAERKVLQSLDLHWTWIRNELGRAEWCLVSAVPVASTATYKKLRFKEDAAPLEGASGEASTP